MSAVAKKALCEREDRRWRDPGAVAAHWREATDVDRVLLRTRSRGGFWGEIERLGVVVLVSREYEHFLLAVSVRDGTPVTTYLALPHPSGIAVDAERGRVVVACTRNPNQLVELGFVREPGCQERVLIPRTATFHPGRLYLHDIAFVGGTLYGSATGLDTIVRLDPVLAAEPVWWPKAIECDGRPDRNGNRLQLNSIAAGPTLEASFFSASAAKPSRRRPGHRNFAVDGRGVIFSGATREPIAIGLTRPHSVRLHDGRLWVDNSGYGEVGVIDREGQFGAVARLRGWTRGLCLVGDVALVATSRIIPRFRQYAPGVEADRSECGLHVVDTTTGQVRGSLIWPSGSQIFAIDVLRAEACRGFPFSAAGGVSARARSVFYDFEPCLPEE
jgi:uncharacterized protein (TIGR03032 family)